VSGSDQTLVEVRREGTTGVLVLRREQKLNAISSAMERDLRAALRSDEIRTSRALVITGNQRAFSAGADVTEMTDTDVPSVMAYYRDTGKLYEEVAALPQPTLSAISGYCLGGGFELALATDFRVADATAVFGLPEVALGILPSSGGAHRLVRAVGPARAKELMLLYPRFGADEAGRLGVVSEVVAEGQALTRCMALAERLSALPPLAVEVAKRAADSLAEASLGAGLLVEQLAYAALAQTAEARAAASAFVAGRARESGQS
jgi:enoyl-CoA hydratase/carnithine racemase